MIEVATREHGRYLVKELFDQTKNIVPFQLPLAELERVLKLKVWRTSYNGMKFSPWELIHQTIKDPVHWKRVIDADLSYSILVMKEQVNWLHDDEDGKTKTLSEHITKYGIWDVIDGYHRLVKAYLLNRENVFVKEVTWEMLQESRVDKKRKRDT